jgi:hypothetical protein
MEMTANGSQGVQAEYAGRKPWIEGFPVCRTLSLHQIIHVGIHPGATPIRVNGSHPTTTYFLASFDGKGRVLINDRWQVFKPNYGCLLPAHSNYAFESKAGSVWKFCWVCYNHPWDQRPITAAESPHPVPFETLPLQAAIAGLLHEYHGAGQPRTIQKWTDLVHAYVLRFAESSNRLTSLAGCGSG